LFAAVQNAVMLHATRREVERSGQDSWVCGRVISHSFVAKPHCMTTAVKRGLGNGGGLDTCKSHWVPRALLPVKAAKMKAFLDEDAPDLGI